MAAVPSSFVQLRVLKTTVNPQFDRRLHFGTETLCNHIDHLHRETALELSLWMKEVSGRTVHPY